ncbi:MAG: hypothetical protein HY736_07185 [Verrucomicrobia bacterium]|nr:hypothetical protein [Verrucomicrobiota bacterium]
MDSDLQPQHAPGLRKRLAELTREINAVEEQLAALDGDAQLELRQPRTFQPVHSPSTPAEKVALFLELFATRRSVFPQRWENARTGKDGYSPVCDNEWHPGI